MPGVIGGLLPRHGLFLALSAIVLAPADHSQADELPKAVVARIEQFAESFYRMLRLRSGIPL
jgi:hypothetical protein